MKKLLTAFLEFISQILSFEKTTFRLIVGIILGSILGFAIGIFVGYIILKLIN